MNKEAWRTLAFVSVGAIAAFVSMFIDLSLRSSTNDTNQLALIGIILLSVAAIGYLGTYIAEFVGTNIEAEGGRIRTYIKSLWIYIITWFVLYTLLFNEFVFPG